VYQQALPATALLVQPSHKPGLDNVGTGTLIDADRRLLVTANHVVPDGDGVTVYFGQVDRNGDAITDLDFYTKNPKCAIHGRVAKRNVAADVALVQLERAPENVRAIRLAAERPQPSDELHVIGNSGIDDGALWRYTHGNVRNVYSKQWDMDDGRRHSAWVIEMEAPTNHGDSGGPVLNGRGELIGVVSNGVPTVVQDGKKVVEGPHELEYAIEVREVRALLADFDAGAPAAPPATTPPAKPTAPPAGKKPALDLAGTAWASEKVVNNGLRIVLVFQTDGTLLTGVLDADGTFTEKGTARFTRTGDSLTIREEGRSATYRVRRDGQGRLHLTDEDGDESVWLPGKLS
jgi:S1-C subfamily serine protease